MICRTQDLPEYNGKMDFSDMLEIAVKVNSDNSDGYISKNLDYGQILSSVARSVSANVENKTYSYSALPLGTVMMLDTPILSSEMLSGQLFPLNGTKMTFTSGSLVGEFDSDMSSVSRGDVEDFFLQLDRRIMYTDQGVYPQEGYNIIVYSLEYTYDFYDKNPEYDGYFLYDPEMKTVRMPRLCDCYIKSSSYESESHKREWSSLPNIYGKFPNGITTGEIADGEILSDLYGGMVSIETDNIIEYYESMNSVRDSIYKKSLSKVLREADIMTFDPHTQNVDTPYYRDDEKVTFDSVKVYPCIVVRGNDSTSYGL